ncbi:Gfo/Idh/MocA family protein [Jiangella endophytica]|uniref:Gfo/Idh/MocA family protein n=1 Tax=Jiangella endophytica TaxID=1623398 RepID=UPI0013002524|nr:Gfo/Idh/MocA family oxidoreductase [Jiangella endophytica]
MTTTTETNDPAARRPSVAHRTTPRLRAAVVGAGTGGSLSITALRNSARYELVGVADLRPEALETYAPAVATALDHRDLLSSVAPDVLCISTYAPTHEAIAAAAIDLPVRGLLVEKPLSDTTAGGRAILALARERGIPVVVPHGLMAMTGPREVVRRVREGDLGELRLVEIECADWDVINAGIHWLQFFLALVHPEPVVSVLAACDTSTRTFRDGMQVETEATVVARCRNGTRMIMNTGDHLPVAGSRTGAVIRIVGTDGLIEYAPWENEYAIAAAGAPRSVVTGAPLGVSGHQYHLDHLADLLATNTVDDVVPATSLAALEVVEAAYLSHRERAAVSLPLEHFVAPERSGWDPGAPYAGVGGGRDGRRL